VALGKCADKAATSLLSCCSTPSFVLTNLMPGPVCVRIHALRQMSGYGLQQNLGGAAYDWVFFAENLPGCLLVREFIIKFKEKKLWIHILDLEMLAIFWIWACANWFVSLDSKWKFASALLLKNTGRQSCKEEKVARHLYLQGTKVAMFQVCKG